MIPIKTCLNKKREEQIKKYRFYKKEFGILNQENRKPVELFERLLMISSEFKLECSHKICESDIYSFRINLWYGGNKKDKLKSLNDIFSFFKNISLVKDTSINYSLIKHLFETKLDFNKIDRIICGIDYREKYKDSRIKFWLRVEDYPHLVQSILKLGDKGRFKELMYNNDLLFGFDLYFDGRTGLKIYPSFNLNNTRGIKKISDLETPFDPMVLKLIKECARFHLSFDADGRKVLHFIPRRQEEFIQKINNKLSDMIQKKYAKAGYGLEVISLLENEIKAGKIKHINLYY